VAPLGRVPRTVPRSRDARLRARSPAPAWQWLSWRFSDPLLRDEIYSASCRWLWRRFALVLSTYSAKAFQTRRNAEVLLRLRVHNGEDVPLMMEECEAPATPSPEARALVVRFKVSWKNPKTVCRAIPESLLICMTGARLVRLGIIPSLLVIYLTNSCVQFNLLSWWIVHRDNYADCTARTPVIAGHFALMGSYSGN